MSIFDGRVAVVTGSARGIGRAAAELLVEGGAKVVISDLDRDAAKPTAAEIGGDQAKGKDSVIDVDGRIVQVGVPEQTRTKLTALVPLQRPASPREAAGGIAFLCSPWSDYVTGQVLSVPAG